MKWTFPTHDGLLFHYFDLLYIIELYHIKATVLYLLHSGCGRWCMRSLLVESVGENGREEWSPMSREPNSA